MSKVDEASLTDEQKYYYEMLQKGIKADNTHEETNAIYSEFSEYYDKSVGFFNYRGPDIAAKEASILLKKNNNAKILDVCAGTGLVAEKLLAAGFSDIDYLDDNDELREKAKEKNIYKRFIKCFLGRDNIDATENEYDAAMLVGALCDGNISEKCFSCFSEIIRVIKPGGVFYASIGENYVTDKYTETLNKHLDKLVKDGLFTWICKGKITDQGHSEMVWVFSVCKGTEVNHSKKENTEEIQELLNSILDPNNSAEDRNRLYNESADSYDKDCEEFGYRGPRLAAGQALKYLPEKGCRILDVCAGTGLVGEELQKLGFKDIDYLDGNEQMRSKAEKKNIYKNFFNVLLGNETIAAENGTYDGIWMVGALCPGHIRPEDFSECFRELARITKSGGIFYGCIGLEYFPPGTEEYRDKVKKAFDELAEEGLWTWLFFGEMTDENDTEAVWVLKRCG